MVSVERKIVVEIIEEICSRSGIGNELESLEDHDPETWREFVSACEGRVRSCLASETPLDARGVFVKERDIVIDIFDGQQVKVLEQGYSGLPLSGLVVSNINGEFWWRASCMFTKEGVRVLGYEKEAGT